MAVETAWRVRGERTATAVAGLGILSVLAGALALAFPAVVALGVTYAVGVFLAAAGIVHLIDGLRGPGQHWLEALLGFAYLAIGVLVFAQPMLAALSLVTLLAFLLWIGGAFRLAAAFTGEAQHRLLAGLGGVCALALGFLVLLSDPAQALWTLGLFAGIELLFSGLSMIRFSRTELPRLEKPRAPLTP